MYYTISKREKYGKIPIFYSELLEKILEMSGIEKISEEALEQMIDQTETLIGLPRNDPRFEQLYSFIETRLPRNTLLCETAILVINDDGIWDGIEDNSIVKIHSDNDKSNLSELIAQSRVVFLNGSNLQTETFDSILQNEIPTELFILVNYDSEELIQALILAGVKWVVVVESDDILDQKIASLLLFRVSFF